MATSTLAAILPTMCQQFFSSIPKSAAGIFWFFVQLLWPWYWLAIIVGLGIWVAVEILTRNGGLHYNSENGFSPAFNRLVGSGVYALFQFLTYLVLRLIFGDGVYCSPLPYVVHPLVLFLTWLFLRIVGFWVY